MVRSMFTAIGGLRNHQVMLDVTANNIANVNTVGYKAQRVNFESMMAQMLSGASAPVADGIGGSGPTQIGLGMSLNSIGSLLTQGSLQTTSQWSDLAISGEGYFAVAKEVTTTGNGALPATPDIAFTRAGNFTTDKAGWLVTPGGQYVLASPPDGAGGFLPNELRGIKVDPNAQSVSIDQNGVVTFIDSAGAAVVGGRIALAKFPNPAGLARVGGNLLKETQNSGSFDPVNQAGEVIWGQPNAEGRGSILAGRLEMSNVDLALEFTQMITAQRGFQANTRVITTSDDMLSELVNIKR
jgi:flagellar hook protein FlgE